MTPEQTIKKVQDFLKENQIELTVNVITTKPALLNAFSKDILDVILPCLQGQIVPKFVGSVTQKLEPVKIEENGKEEVPQT